MKILKIAVASLGFLAFAYPCFASPVKHHRHPAPKTLNESLNSIQPFGTGKHTLAQKVSIYNFTLNQAIIEATKAEKAFAQANKLSDQAKEIQQNGFHQDNLAIEPGSTEAKSLVISIMNNATANFHEAETAITHCQVILLVAMRDWQELRKEPDLLSHYHLSNNLGLAPFVPKQMEGKGLQDLRLLIISH